MGDSHHPRRGSMQFWPRKRAGCSIARIATWVKETKVKPLGFIGYKAGMTHLQVVDNRPKSLTKGENIFMPVTIIDCPPITVMGLVFYKNSSNGLIKISQVWAPKLDKELADNFPLPKNSKAKLENIKEFDEVRLLVHSNPKQTTIGAKKPKVMEIAIGGKKEEKLNYAKELLGKEISLKDVFDNGMLVDFHGITKGKGYQGTVKRFGVPIRQHKAEKTKRGIGTLGPWHPKRILYTVPQGGKMGYHLRTEYNKQIIKVGDKIEEVNPNGGIKHYGLVRNHYLLVKGSVMGPSKRALVLTPALRPDKKITKEAPQISYLHK